MKKISLLLTALITSFVITACGSEESLELEEVMNQAIEATNTLQSFSVDMDMTQTMSNGEEEMVMDSQSQIDTTVEPFAIYQKMTMNMNGLAPELEETEGMPENIDMEMYLTEEGFYMQNPMMDGWISLPAESHEELMSLSTMSQDPAKEIERLKQYIDDFEFTEENDQYHLSLTLSGEKLNEFLQESITEVLPDLEMDQEMLENSTFNKVDYTYTINKETFYPEQLTMFMDFEMTIEGETVHMIQEIDGTYSNFNNIDEIVIPDEVKENVMTLPELPQ